MRPNPHSAVKKAISIARVKKNGRCTTDDGRTTRIARLAQLKSRSEKSSGSTGALGAGIAFSRNTL